MTIGVHGVPPLPTAFPNPVGMSPASGSVNNSLLTWTSQDAAAAANLQTSGALINTALDGRSACYVASYRPANLVFLYPDNGEGTQAASMVLSGTDTLSNSRARCRRRGVRRR